MRLAKDEREVIGPGFERSPLLVKITVAVIGSGERSLRVVEDAIDRVLRDLQRRQAGGHCSPNVVVSPASDTRFAVEERFL